MKLLPVFNRIPTIFITQLQAAYRKENRIADADRELEIYKQIKAASRDRVAEAVKSNP